MTMYAPVYNTSSFQISLHREHLHLERPVYIYNIY